MLTLNSSMNFFIYAMASADFRRVLIETIKKNIWNPICHLVCANMAYSESEEIELETAAPLLQTQNCPRNENENEPQVGREIENGNLENDVQGHNNETAIEILETQDNQSSSCQK